MGERALQTSALVLVLLCASVPTHSHPLAPSLLVLTEEQPGLVHARWKTPARAAPGASPRPVLPVDCAPVGEPAWEREGTGRVVRFSARCSPEGLVGSEVGVDGLAASRTQALLEVSLADGRTFREVLRAGRARFVVPERAGFLAVARGYGELGVRHILGGPDHLLFVFGLMLLVGGGLPLLGTVSAFTLGHSITLSLAALGFVHFPATWVEIAIAVSLVWLGVELVRAREPAARARGRKAAPLAAGLFGLLHGFGFAGALSEVGLPPGSIPVALLSFNVGVEVGQLAFVAAGLALRALLGPALEKLPARAYRVAPYAVGSSGAFWMFDRLLGD